MRTMASEQSEEGKQTASRCRSIEEYIVALEGKTTEQSETQHGPAATAIDWGLTAI
jgi:hypothetical protein